MELSRVIPLEEIERLLGRPVEQTRLETDNVAAILEATPKALYGIAAHAWHRIVTAGQPRVDPMQMRRYFQDEDPRLAEAIGAVIGRPLLKGFGFARATIRYRRQLFTVATSCLAHVHSDELQLYDIAMADPRRPISREARTSPLQRHGGFGLLGEVLKNVFTAARERGCSVVTLTAGDSTLVRIFERHGFRVEDNSFARDALAAGIGVPMEAAVPELP